jgi:histidine ammonia-lyase
MLGMLVLALARPAMLLRTADIAAAMSVEGQLGTDRRLRRRPAGAPAADGQAGRPPTWSPASATRVIVASHRGRTTTACRTPTRCAARPGARRRPRHLAHAATVAGRELASVDRQPGRHRRRPRRVQRQLPRGAGRLRARLPRDLAADVASISERRTDRFLDKARSHGLPPFLADDPGVDSGHMIAQYTQAAIVSELKRLAVPPSVDSIPSSAMQEDHVSMGWSAARKLRRAVDGLDPRARDRDPHRRARARPARTAEPSPATGAVATCCAPPVPRAPAPTASSRRRSKPSPNSSSRATSPASQRSTRLMAESPHRDLRFRHHRSRDQRIR